MAIHKVFIISGSHIFSHRNTSSYLRGNTLYDSAGASPPRVSSCLPSRSRTTTPSNTELTFGNSYCN
ncbi:hypothetical protein BBBOND_0308160 [Babesia bigemina]|uniref:Uncharacterized protein n=1 Tax=Babesia bigemina TaxID=5866 RepID=A0A061DAB3_BABBI|nr:hypothetical protein BBBOND_0308160 [Babesia bigemina]CDR96912.1 hypothetical protein BBBOND_0308160 [Babesia bigemina]|eukprot:XP_012769098.1 hypothetical protein BBBOND_0308160 [Babesia bigemina]